MTKDKKKNNYVWFGLIAILIIVVISMLIYYFLFNKQETHISEELNMGKATVVECESDKMEEGFFTNEKSEKETNSLKVMFDDDKIIRVFYNYIGEYDSSEAAETANAVLHGKYNKYMASKSIDPDSLDPTFSNSDKIMKIVLNADIKDINNSTVDLFFLTMDDFQHIKSYSPDKLAKLYKSKGFACEVHK